MENIFSYLNWRGDLTFDESSFNEVDNVILCAFSYIHFERFLSFNEVISIEDLYSRYKKSNQNNSNIFLKNQNTLFSLLYKSNRFKNVKITHFINEVSEEEEKQFCALTYILSDKTIFVAFRGTDENLVAWKENFNLSYMDVIPAQKRAVDYLENILNHTKKEVIIGGHSKGGNLAVYAFLFCKENLRKKIVSVYNNDGPGLNKNILDQKKSKELGNKIITFIPESSIVGNLFTNFSKTIIIESDSLGILQHDLYTWLVLNNHFVYSKKMDEKTREVCAFLNQMIDKLSPSKKRDIINFIYDIFISFGITNIEDKIYDIMYNNQLLKKYHFQLEDIEILRTIIPLVLQIIKSL